MELRYYLRLLRKWIWLAILGGILGAALGFGYSAITVPVYQSTVTLLISQGTDPLRDPYYSMITSQRAAITYVEQLKSPEVLEQVARELNIATLAGGLPASVSVQNVRDTQLIRVSVEDTDPARAQAIANQIARVFNDQLNTFQMERYRIVQEDMDRQVAEARKKIDETQKALAPLGDANDPRSLAAPEFVRTERQRLQLELTTLQSQYAVLLKSAQDVRLAASRYTDSVSISSPAKLPLAPVRPRTSMNMLIGLAIGALLGLGLAFLVEYLDDSVKNSDDVSRVLELGTLGTVVRFPKGTKSPLVAVDAPRAPYVEAYRNLRTNLQFSFAVDAAATLVVTSAEPGEGKSTTIANLAVVMAQMGKRVMLVDTDLRRPTQHLLFGIPAEPGLTDVFLGEQTLDQVVRATQVPGLHLLASGRLPPNPAELLASTWMDHFIALLKERYDIVLFDSPPILPVTDAILLASKTKHLAWIISAGKTRTETLRRAREALAQVDAKILGVVLNRVTGGSGYGYYYYYYYSKDGGKKKHAHAEGLPVTPSVLISGNGNGKGKATELQAPPEKLG
ncbi:MAG: polysaccharide biosynthesis tyrosine autokinase [Chloroflexi bacterium]|nr:polysaccharide biosynthesis tyrosine autokinase [Chloroflexota bacterium]